MLYVVGRRTVRAWETPCSRQTTVLRDHKFPGKFPESYILTASQISSRISGNLHQGQTATLVFCIIDVNTDHYSRSGGGGMLGGVIYKDSKVGPESFVF